jgi:hypothetical protein
MFVFGLKKTANLRHYSLLVVVVGVYPMGCNRTVIAYYCIRSGIKLTLFVLTLFV